MITKSDLHFMRLAEVMSTYSDYSRVKIGSCIVYKKRIVSTGCNKTKSHPIQEHYNKYLPYTVRFPYLHAEMDALIKAGSEAKGATIYIFRRGRDGVYRNCKPCKACMNFIIDSEIKRIVWTTENGILEKTLHNKNREVGRDNVAE